MTRKERTEKALKSGLAGWVRDYRESKARGWDSRTIRLLKRDIDRRVKVLDLDARQVWGTEQD